MANEAAQIFRDDSRYQEVVSKRFNKRFIATPDYVYLAESTGEVVAAVQHAVREARRLVVTSGGHCLEGFVSDPDVRVIIDVSKMKRVYYDAEQRAVAIEAGATVGEALRALFESWGVVVPLGEFPHIGIGGHVVGGAFGFLCRQLGLAADYLHGVEVVTVDTQGQARSVIATRDSKADERELWWAHTGIGGGNLGIVTRYWFRAPDASGDDPRTLLPRAPESITTLTAEWSWSALDRDAFRRLLQNYGRWSEQTARIDAPDGSLFTLLEGHRKQFGKIIVRGVSTAGDGARAQIERLLATLSEGTARPSAPKVERLPWLKFALDPFAELFEAPPEGVRMKAKDALLKRALTDRQLDIAYDHLTSEGEDIMGGMLGLASYGGRVNAVAPDATASGHRAAILDLACNVGWSNAHDDAACLAWVRRFYSELFADTGGVPAPGEAYAGALINHPDADLADPALNTSGTPWHALYYPANYARLQRIKARWDPRNVFSHALSVRLP